MINLYYTEDVSNIFLTPMHNSFKYFILSELLKKLLLTAESCTKHDKALDAISGGKLKYKLKNKSIFEKSMITKI
jgi:hypothetical protein